ncbi:exosome component 10 [Contarinia nasturtii]|uniref:exosome component 10 n=1 Tax=Contarinia nasturtii TaxID=265458 RepID=UPI0012D40A8D|nr:exosome component 10 [Contarinia nasturtii]
MAEKNSSKIEDSDKCDGSSHSEATTSTHQIKDVPVEQFTKNGMALIVEATKCTNAFPSNASRNLYSAYPAFNKAVQRHSDHILSMISKVVKLQHIKGNIQRRDNDEKMELLQECNDVMLERINSNLDSISGIRKNIEPILVETEISTTPSTPKQNVGAGSGGSWNERKTPGSAQGIHAKLLTARNIIRPQINFKTPVDNSANTPFIPQLKYKPHSMKPLAILPEYDDIGNIESYLHPYEFELSKFTPNEWQLTKGSVTKPKELSETTLMYVDKENDLNVMLKELEEAKEIAIDVEHHSYRTFQGITCLLQLSTRTKDYIVDTLALRDELHILNEVTANPKIVKVFHGADSDIEWLQRDLSIYVVNMFDTHQASKRLKFARLSLAFLLKHYCQIEADKSLQLADWRMRPLPAELISYAQQDTHYLLYIYDMLRNELIAEAHGKTNLLLNVYKVSTDICMKRYIKVTIKPDSHMDMYRKSKRIFDNRQFYALKELFKWRDSIARSEDESYAYVLPNHMMLQIAENLPREMQGILACCNPIPPLVRQHLHVLHRFILQAREQPLTKIVLDDQAINRSTILSKNQDVNSHLYCPHDLTGNTEFRDDLPTLLGNKNTIKVLPETVLSKLKLNGPSVSAFHTSSRIEKKTVNGTQVKFFSPYARYLAVLPFAEEERLADLAKKAEENRKRKLCPDSIIDTPKPQKPIENAEDSGYRGSLRDFDKNTTQPPAKKRRVDTQSDDPIEAKLNAIRTNIDQQDQQSGTNADNASTTPKKNKKKNKNKNKTPQQSSMQSKKPDFDYSNVDFKEFGGGSIVEQKNEIKMKFHGKGKSNKANKRFLNMLSKNTSNKK